MVGESATADTGGREVGSLRGVVSGSPGRAVLGDMRQVYGVLTDLLTYPLIEFGITPHDCLSLPVPV